MAREAKVRWDEKAKAWRSDVGPRGANNRRATVYFRRDGEGNEIPNSRAGERTARKLLQAYLDDRAERETAEHTDLSNPSVEQLRMLWLSHVKREHAPETYLVSKSAINQFCAFRHQGVAYRDRRASSLGATDLARFLESKKAAGRKPHYLAKLAGVVQAMLNWSANPQPDRSPERLLPDGNPLHGMSGPAVPESPERFAEAKVIAAFFCVWRKSNAQRPRSRRTSHCERLTMLLVRCLVQTGARPHEFHRAEWTHIEWKAGQTKRGHTFGKIVLPAEKWKVGKKTGKPRTVYLTPVLTRALRRESEHPDRHPTHIFCRIRKRRLKEGEIEVAAGLDLWNANALAQHIRHIRRLAAKGVLPDEGPNRVVGYLFRHTAASLALMRGMDAVTVAALLGTSPQMLQKHYGHILDGHLVAASEQLTEARRPKPE